MNRQWIVLGAFAAAAIGALASGWALASRRCSPQVVAAPTPRVPAPPREFAAAPSHRGPVVRIPSYPQSITVEPFANGEIQLCQAVCGPECSPGCRLFTGVDCQTCNPCGEANWTDQRPIPWEMFAQGEYVGPHRTKHVPEYRLRVDDQLDFVYRLTRIESSKPYELNVGDSVRVESLTDPNLDRELVIQPDGSITLRLLGQVQAARRTVTELTDDLEEQYKKYYKVPAVTVTPIQVNTKLEDLRAAVDGRFGAGGQNRLATVTPEGTIQLPAIGSISVQGLTIDEVKREVDERYNEVVNGIEVTPVLVQRAPRYVYVLGEVQIPNRYELTGPTTLMASISLAGGWNPGGNLREVVVFRRTEDWRLMATKIDIQGALWGKRPCPADEIWLRDSDIVVVPKSPILRFDDFVELYFTRGLYGVAPISGSLTYSRNSTL
ncbi:MAG: polysaccharide biosynthesis/export family protein [Pirellulaceae bacterium]